MADFNLCLTTDFGIQEACLYQIYAAVYGVRMNAVDSKRMQFKRRVNGC